MLALVPAARPANIILRVGSDSDLLADNTERWTMAPSRTATLSLHSGGRYRTRNVSFVNLLCQVPSEYCLQMTTPRGRSRISRQPFTSCMGKLDLLGKRTQAEVV